jgi:hypothetical protein
MSVYKAVLTVNSAILTFSSTNQAVRLGPYNNWYLKKAGTASSPVMEQMQYLLVIDLCAWFISVAVQLWRNQNQAVW